MKKKIIQIIADNVFHIRHEKLMKICRCFVCWIRLNNIIELDYTFTKGFEYSLAHDAMFGVGKSSGLFSKIDGTAGAEYPRTRPM